MSIIILVVDVPPHPLTPSHRGAAAYGLAGGCCDEKRNGYFPELGRRNYLNQCVRDQSLSEMGKMKQIMGMCQCTRFIILFLGAPVRCAKIRNKDDDEAVVVVVGLAHPCGG